MLPPIEKMDIKKYQIKGLSLHNIEDGVQKLHKNKDLDQCLLVCKSVIREHSVRFKVEESNPKNSSTLQDVGRKSTTKATIANFIHNL